MSVRPSATVRLIDGALLDAVSAEAASRPRRRANWNFHAADDFPAHRLLNAIEPDSYLPPHRHLDPLKDETILVLRGTLGVLLFTDDGQVVTRWQLAAGGDRVGVDIPHGTWHTVVALEPGTVIFEAKAGPYRPLADGERAPWAPIEGDPAAAGFWDGLRALFAA